jgi:hypothetical protein
MPSERNHRQVCYAKSAMMSRGRKLSCTYIITVPGRGYRFIGSIVTEMEQSATAAAPQVDTAREAAPTPRADAERRQITATSCELIGISGGADGVGLEDLRHVVAAFQRCVSETVDRHDGFVVSRLGNAALVLFGSPAAHEYDAERAVRAGLELCARDPMSTCRCGAGSASRPAWPSSVVSAGMARSSTARLSAMLRTWRLWVKGRKTRSEYMFSELARIADIVASAGSLNVPKTRHRL